MSLFTLIARGLVYHRRMHAGLVVGVALACAILAGALIVGDSIEYSLKSIAASRLGLTTHAMSWPNRFFNQDLATRLDKDVEAAALLALNGTLSLPPDARRDRKQINRVQVLGVENGFWRFAQVPPVAAGLGPQEVALNERAAEALGVKAGDDLLLRVSKPGRMPLDAPLSSRKDEQYMTSLVTVRTVLSQDELGGFSLAANQSPPFNAFVDRAWLQEQTDKAGLANLLLAADDAQALLEQAWQLEDVGLRLRGHASGVIQLESDNVFLDEEAVRAAGHVEGARGTLTYLVNSISRNGRMTPYSFVEAGPVPESMRDDEVIINQWLAEQLQAAPGDALEIAYYRLMPNNAFVEEARPLKVHSVAPMESLKLERELAPVFPGLSDVESCTDWSVGMPMDDARLKDKPNEDYWHEFGQTPKLLVTLKAGQEMWGNRFGNVTAVRFSASDEAAVAQAVRGNMIGAKLGLQFVPVKEMANEAVAQAIDFGGLFMGMSFFLIVSALILTGLLYVFGVQHRTSEVAILTALGFCRARIAAIFLAEALPVAALGAVLGVVAGAAYARGLLWVLSRYWPAAVAGASIQFRASGSSLLIAAGATLVCAVVIMLVALWRMTRLAPREILVTDFSFVAQGHRRGLVLPTLALVAAAAIETWVWVAPPVDFTGPFFGAGTLILLGEIGYYRWLLSYLSGRPSFRAPRLWKFAVANFSRRRGRSLSVACLTAFGCFLVFSVSSMQQNVALDATRRTSGTGGFALFAETTIPVLDPAKVGAGVVALRVRDGDDAGCLNLNRAQTPRLIGVDTAALTNLGAFVDSPGFWDALDAQEGDGAVPAMVGDSDTATWGLKKKVGDVLPYRDESGNEFRIRLVGKLPMRLSVFQGSLLISQSAFTRLFPSEAGFRAFLIDAPQSADLGQAAMQLNSEFERVGMHAVPTVERLRDFYAVEATYLRMFLVLGGLGLFLGAGGFSVVVLRNLFERRNETAILHALGFEPGTLHCMLLAEHALLALSGIAMGTLAAALAVVPLVASSRTEVSLGIQAGLLGVIIVAHLVCTALVVGLTRSPDPAVDLRSE